MPGASSVAMRPVRPAASAYTADDTPAIRQRIQHDIDIAIERVHAGDPHLQALVLTGGFARGEGAVRDGVPQNDYDFVALRGVGRPRTPYADMRKALEDELDFHIDLAPVAAARLPWTPRSIFWYETALRGRVVWGDPRLLQRIRVRRPLDIDRREAMRLLSNRAAGLVFATEHDDDGRRLQASKALLGTMDAWLLSQGVFPPTQTERWHAFDAMASTGNVPDRLLHLHPWLAWAFHYKTRPGLAPVRDGHAAWTAAAKGVLEAVPEALHHAGLPSLAAYERQDSILDALFFLRASRGLPVRAVRHPTSRVRVATLRMLQAYVEGGDPSTSLARVTGPTTRPPLALLEALRGATLQ